jgi:integrase
VSGTPTLDIVVPGVGRIHRHCGTDKPGLVKDIRAAVRLCLSQGRLDLLERLRDGAITPIQLYDAYRTNRLNRLANAGALVPLLPKLEEFEKVYPQSEGYRKDIRLMRRQVEAVARKTATLWELPRLLMRVKARYEAMGAPVTFNRHKRVAMSFVTWALGQSESPLWDEVRRVPSMAYKRPEKPGLTVEEFRMGVAKLPAPHAAMAWSLVLTGMNWKEYAEDGWDADPEAGIVKIHGAKRESRDRVIPYLAPLVAPTRDYRAFRKQGHRAFGPAVTPHTFRRTFIQWAEKAGISRFRVKLYCGHTVGQDVTDLYENEKVGADVRQSDRKKLVAYIGRPLGAVSLTLEARSA